MEAVEVDDERGPILSLSKGRPACRRRRPGTRRFRNPPLAPLGLRPVDPEGEEVHRDQQGGEVGGGKDGDEWFGFSCTLSGNLCRISDVHAAKDN